MNLPDYNKWKPWSIEKVAEIFKDVQWILAGGFALQEYVGKRYRNHNDIDILIKREDQKLISSVIEQSRIFVSTKGKLSPYDKNFNYDFPIQDIWVLGEDFTAWSLQIMLYDIKDGFWIYKRDRSIKLKNSKLFWEKDGIRIIKPEIQLLYKSSNIRPKDEQDYQMLKQILDEDAKEWLNSSLIKSHYKHIWISP